MLELQNGEVEFDASLGARSFHVVAQNIGHDFPAFLHERLLFEFFFHGWWFYRTWQKVCATGQSRFTASPGRRRGFAVGAVGGHQVFHRFGHHFVVGALTG